MYEIKLKIQDEADLYNPLDPDRVLLSDDVVSYILRKYEERPDVREKACDSYFQRYACGRGAGQAEYPSLHRGRGKNHEAQAAAQLYKATVAVCYWHCFHRFLALHSIED